MDPLVRAALFVRRAFRRASGLALAALLAAFVLLGGANAPLIAIAPALVLWIALVGSRVHRTVKRTIEVPALAELELGVLLTILCEALLIRFDGKLGGAFSPAIYVLVAFCTAYSSRISGALVVAFVIAFEAALRHFTLHEANLEGLIPHAAFVVAFATLNLIFLRAQMIQVRNAARARIDRELSRLKEDARSYRLLGGGDDGAKSDDKLARSSVEEIHQSVHYALDLLRRTLGLHTAVLLWLNDAGTHMRISELSTESEDISDAPIAIGDGVLAAVHVSRERASLKSLKPSYKVPYYAGPNPVRALCAIPLLDGQTLRGILAIDRIEDKAFSAHEEELAAQAARHCLRAIQNERVFLQLERAKVEQGKLYRAAQALGAALSENDVLEAGVKAAREVASFDLAAVTIYDEAHKTHEVRAAKCSAEVGEDIEDLVGARFAHNAGLVSMVVQNRFPLPYKGDFDPQHQVVLNKRFPWPKLPSLLVLPLVLRDRALGTLILGARRRHAFGDSVRPTLEVLASHLAVSLANARAVHELEMMATTDGLTGLLNKRAMLEAAEQKITAAARFDKKLSVLVIDIDHFKKVNDTWGHDVGDVVIKGLGEILKRQKRATDMVARFGGEEFIVLCEETNDKGAMLLAERIREELEKTAFHTEKASIKVTCSVGIATLSDGVKSWETMFKAADDALYVSKRSGRNRATASVPKATESAARHKVPA
jgi:diguanylate cyclase (GGDEF)-like protein